MPTFCPDVSNFNKVYLYTEEALNDLSDGGKLILLEAKVYALAFSIEQSGHQDELHAACLKRMPKYKREDRDLLQVISLLLCLVSNDSFDRHKRYRLCKVLKAAKAQGVLPTLYIDWRLRGEA